MAIEDILNDVKEAVRNIVPRKVKITDIEIEGSVIALYTTSVDTFADNSDIVKHLAHNLKRRVTIRPDPSILAEIELAEKEIKEIIPKEAEITDIYFEPDIGEVTIEAKSPGLAIGKHGQVLNEIKRKLGWASKVVRSPPIPSKTVKDVRYYLRSVGEERKEILRKVGRKICRQTVAGDNWVRITALGGFREVGRSCALLSTKDSKVLVDCGINVSETNSSPYLNAPEALPLETLDAVIITHAHLDHSGLVPLLYMYGYNGPVYCTPPTRDLMSLLQLDYLKVAVSDGRRAPYKSEQIKEVVKHCIPLRYGDTTDISPDVRLTLQNGGHILGSSIAHFHIGDGLHNVAFTGDIKFEKTWLFNPSTNKFPRLETLVIEATYGGKQDLQPSRDEASKQLKEIVKRTLEQKGKILIPVFAVGRSQEVMLVLEKMMRGDEYKDIPIYLDGMIWEATAIHTAYPEYLNNHLRTQIFQRKDNPFLSEVFKRVDSTEMRNKILDDTDPCIVLATSGMMNGGPIIEYFKYWAQEKKNTLIFVGYQAEGTLGKKIQKGWSEIPMSAHGRQITVNVNMNIETCDGFSGHSDRRQLLNYIYSLNPRPERIIVNHGESAKCLELAVTIRKKYGADSRAPLNLETVRCR